MLWDLEIQMRAPFTDLIVYPDEDKDEFIENPRFKKIREYLKIDIDIVRWAEECYEILQGKRHLCNITLYSSPDKKSYVLLDRYLDPEDQLDLITIGLKTQQAKGEGLRTLSREFNDASEYNIHYAEGSNVVFQSYPLDEESLRRFPAGRNSEYIKGKVIIKQ